MVVVSVVVVIVLFILVVGESDGVVVDAVYFIDYSCITMKYIRSSNLRRMLFLFSINEA